MHVSCKHQTARSCCKTKGAGYKEGKHKDDFLFLKSTFIVTILPEFNFKFMIKKSFKKTIP